MVIHKNGIIQHALQNKDNSNTYNEIKYSHINIKYPGETADR